MKTVVNNVGNAPAAIGPYSQAVKAGDFLFVSGQIPVEPETGDIADTIQAQTEQVLKNLAAILESQGLGLGQVVKTSVFLKDLNDFQDMNAVYGNFFPREAPARACVQVARLPKDVMVEIDAVAVYS